MLADKREAPESAKHSIRYKAKLYALKRARRSSSLCISSSLAPSRRKEQKKAKKMSGRRHVVAGSNPWSLRSGGKGAEDRHRDREGENGEAGGERSSSETLTTATATATATTHTSFDIKRFINDKLDSRHRDKDKDDNSLTVVPPHHTSDSSAPTRPGSVSPTPTQFSPTSTAVMASPPSSSSKVLASPSKVWFHFCYRV